jgi:hypothetical protein
MIFSKARSIAQPDGVDLLGEFFRRLRCRYARECFEVRRDDRLIRIVVVGDPRIGKRELIEVVFWIPKVRAEVFSRAGIEILLDCIEIDFGMKILGKVPGMAIAWLRLAADMTPIRYILSAFSRGCCRAVPTATASGTAAAPINRSRRVARWF